jgi:predicted ATP-dependent protease
MSERGWLAQSPLVESPDTLDCEPIDMDVAVLATCMGVPKEGSSAGVTIVTGIVSALKQQQIRK